MAADLAEQCRLLAQAQGDLELCQTLEGRNISLRGKVVGNLVRLLSGSNALAQAYFTDSTRRRREVDTSRHGTVVE
jgi:hypothetical protein